MEEDIPSLLDDDDLDLSSRNLYEIPAALFGIPVAQLVYLTLDHNSLDTLPSEIYRFVNLQQLSIVGNELHKLPDGIAALENLNMLNVNENNLQCLPDDIGGVKSLRVLWAIGNKLTTLPDSIVELDGLEELYLDENKFTCLPTSMKNLQSLKVLEIMNNQIAFLPSDIGKLCSLEILNLKENRIRDLPESFCELDQLTFLDVSFNRIEVLSDKVGFACTIEKLYLENNDLKYVPEWFSNLVSLEELSISDNALQAQPFNEDFCKSAVNLRSIEAGTNYISTLAVNFGNLKSLEYLHLGSTILELERSNFQKGNWIKALPGSFSDLHKLKKANLNENQISHLPEAFGNLLSLTWLDLGQNMLRTLPESFCELANLEFLQLSKNLLERLPEDIGRLSKLCELLLDSNHLTSVPGSLAKITNLMSLDLFRNHLEEIPQVVSELHNLKRLDLDQNYFKLDLSSVPKITPVNNYPDRDLSLKHDWRGKTRPDKQSNVTVVLNDRLRDAVIKGKSLWRSHSTNGDESRETALDEDECWVPLNLPSKETKSNNDEFGIEPEENWDEEIDANAKFQDVTKSCERSSKGLARLQNIDFQTAINRYPPAKQCFSQSANYESLIYTKTVLNAVSKDPLHALFADGQFDDA